MLCSSCSRPVTPVVAVDIDGTMGDYHTHFLDFLKKYLGYVGTLFGQAYTGDESFKRYCMGLFDITEKEWQDIKLAYRQGAQKRSMPTFAWAQPMTGFIRHEGAELWITTTRPYLRLDNIDPDTREWLARNHIEFDGLIYDKYKYERLAEQVDAHRVIAALDDLPEKADEAAEHFGSAVPILKLGRYNESAKGYFGCRSLRDATVEIIERINRWKELHA